MSCTKHILNLRWEHHAWRPRVTGYEILWRPATNMWARVVDEPYMRCDKEEVCDVCGKVRRRVSCVCDLRRGEGCKFRLATMTEPGAGA